MAEPTGGEWTYDPRSRLVTSDERTICEVLDTHEALEGDSPESDPNGYLLAAAQQLLAACEAIVSWRDVPSAPDDERDGFHALNDVVDQAVAAIAAAKPPRR